VSPVIVVWEASSTKTLSLLSGFHANAVTHLDFSADGKVSIYLSIYLSIYIYIYAHIFTHKAHTEHVQSTHTDRLR
jgi:WD40 repeat protein